MNPIMAVEVTTLESLFQVAYEATIQAEQQRLDWNGRKFAEQADAAWESFHDACDRFRRQYRPGWVPVDPDYEEDYAILEAPTVQEMMIEAVHRFNELLTNSNYDAVDYETAADYLANNHNDPWTAALEFSRCNPYSADEALTAAQGNI